MKALETSRAPGARVPLEMFEFSGLGNAISNILGVVFCSEVFRE